MNYETEYTDYINKTFYWLQMDTESLYQKNLNEHYDVLKHNGWIDREITYKFNGHGFRSEEFTNDPTVMFLGCSHTCGIGMPYENIWPTLIAKQLNMKSANLGIGGSSPDTAFRMCHGYLNQIKPKLVVFLISPGVRAEYYTSNSKKPMSLSISDFQHEYFKLWTVNEYNYITQRERNITAIKGMCLERNIKFVTHDAEKIGTIYDFARDLAHFGTKTHAKLAETILAKI